MINKTKAIIGIIILFISTCFIFKYDEQLTEHVKNILIFCSIIISIFFINPYIYEIFNYKNIEKSNKKRKFINKKQIVQTLGYVIGFSGLYSMIYSVEYFLLMNQILVVLGGGLIFYAQKNMK